MAGTTSLDVDRVLEDAQQPSREANNLRKNWQNKSPVETVAASRKVFYGVIEPCLSNGESLDQDAIAKIEALFETTFSHIEQQSMQRSSSRSSS